MNNKDVKHQYKDYIITFIITIVLAFIIAAAVEFELLFRCEKKVNFEELNLKNLSKFYTITQLEQMIEKNPKNTAAYIRIADIYNQLNELQKANLYYKKALVASQRSNFALYSYGIFTANNNLINLATTLAEEISANNPKTFEYRAKIYGAIGDSLDKEGLFEGANTAYKISYKYAKNIDDKKFYKQIRTKLSTSYIKTADEKIKNKQIEQAIYDLKNSIEVESNALAKYNLGLIYKDTDPKIAEKYFSRALRQNPYIINPYIYNSLLDKLYKEANYANNNAQIDYYYTQINKFKDKLKKAYIFKSDISIMNSKLVTEKKLFKKPRKTYLSFALKNNTDKYINDLYFEIQIIQNSKNIKIEKKIITKLNPLARYKNSEEIKIDISDKITQGEFTKNDDIHVKYYCKKTQKAPWTLIAIHKINI